MSYFMQWINFNRHYVFRLFILTFIFYFYFIFNVSSILNKKENPSSPKDGFDYISISVFHFFRILIYWFLQKSAFIILLHVCFDNCIPSCSPVCKRKVSSLKSVSDKGTQHRKITVSTKNLLQTIKYVLHLSNLQSLHNLFSGQKNPL